MILQALPRGVASACLLAFLLLTACGGGEGSAPEASGPAADTAVAPPTSVTADTGTSAAAAPTDELRATLAAEVAAEAAAKRAEAALQGESSRQTATTAPAGDAAGAEALTVVAGGSDEAAGPTMGLNAVASVVPSLVVRARGDPAGGIGPQMMVRLDGRVLGTVEVAGTAYADYRFSAPGLATGARLDIVFTNDAQIAGKDRNLYVGYVSDGTQWVTPSATNALIDRGTGAKAFDGVDTVAGAQGVYANGALRLTWPATAAVLSGSALALRADAHRFLQQASFGATPADLEALSKKTPAAWIAEQQALAYAPDFVTNVQAWYNKGDAWRPGGASYTPVWVAQKFWERAANAPDQLRKRVAFALHQIFMVSQADSNLWSQARAYAAYVDLLNKNAFGNWRTLLEDMALSPAMGIYLSHMRNRKEDAAGGRTPDENFARELMQLFSIGLVELNTDGTPRRDAAGNAIETYGTADVMALAKVFTGFGWGYPDAQLTDSNFRWGTPSQRAANDARIDVLPMKAYPGQHSTVSKTLFAGKAWAVTLPAGNSAQADLKAALDALFKHPNTAPFVSRQLIQHLVTSNPTPGYVARVAAVFNNSGAGVRGDLAAVVRAILLDSEARSGSVASFGKLREPVLRVTQWMRALGAKSASGQYAMAYELDPQGQRLLAAPSVFGYFRPGYVPPNTAFSTSGATAPEFQIVNEATVARWLNMAEAMAVSGLGWTGSAVDVSADGAALLPLAADGNAAPLIDRLNLLLLGGRMSPLLRQQIVGTVALISPGASGGATSRLRAALFLTLASPEYLAQP